MIHICINPLFIQLMPVHTYLFQSLSFTYDHWLSRLKVMQDLQSVDYVPKWYWKFEILCIPIFIEQDMVFHSREDPLTSEQQTMYGWLSLEPYHFL